MKSTMNKELKELIFIVIASLALLVIGYYAIEWIKAYGQASNNLTHR